MRPGWEAVTIKIETTKKRELERRTLEHPLYRRWNGPKSYADLIRTAIDNLLADTQAAPHVAKQLEGKTPQRLPVYVHRYRASTSRDDQCESVCGLHGLDDDATTNIAEDVTCPKCKTIQAANARAFAAAELTDQRRTAAKRAPKRAPKKASKRRARR